MEIFIVWIIYIHLERITHLKTWKIKHNDYDDNKYDNNDYCNEEMPTQFNKTLKYNHGEKSLKHHS